MLQYRHGLTDRDIAAAAGVCRSVVREWRQRMGLPPQYRISLSKERAAERIALYESGLTDTAIARRQGVRNTAIQAWRHGLGLHANRRSTKLGLAPAEMTARLALYQRGRSDRQIAEALHRQPATIASWRRRLRLPANGNAGFLDSKSDQARLHLYAKGMIDKEIAKVCERSPSSIAQWRKRKGLPAQIRSLMRSASVGSTRLKSLDAPIGESLGNLHEIVCDDSWSDWLEEMGATVW